MRKYPVEISNFKGMQTGIADPDINAMDYLQNVDTFEEPGIITLRPPYELKYAAPTLPTNFELMGYLGFAHFNDKQAVLTGQEVTLAVCAGALTAIDNGGSPIVSNELEILLYYIRPYWNPTTQKWVDEWQWLNDIIITKVTVASDATYSSMFKVYGGSSHGLGDDSVDKWTCINLTQNIISQVITSKADSANTRINHTLYSSSFVVDDVIIFMKNYIPLTELQGSFNTTDKEINFHNILHDLRIGFGGYENRLGLGIGYRKKFFKCKEFDFTNVHSDLTETALENFATIDDVILNPYSFIPQNAYGLDLVAVAGTLVAGTKYFRLTGKLDGYVDCLLYEGSLEVDGTKNIEIYPYIKLGAHNKRITHFSVYYAEDENSNYYKIKDYVLTADTITKSEWKVTENGFLYLDGVVPELHSESNAVSINADINSVGSWKRYSSLGQSFAEFATTLSINTGSGAPSTYYFNISSTLGWSYSVDVRTGYEFPVSGLKKNTKYKLTVYLKTTKSGGSTAYAFFSNDDNRSTLYPQSESQIGTSFAEKVFIVETNDSELPTKIVIAINSITIEQLAIDNFSLKQEAGSELTPTTDLGSEISAEMGYVPTLQIVRSWDMCVVLNFRAHYLNPYIAQDGRLENFILRSNISGGNISMYDAVIFDNTIEAERFRGEKTIAIAPLANDNILLLKNDGIEERDPETGRTYFNQTGKGIISRESLEVIGGIPFWCSLEDAHAYVNQDIKDWMSDSIRKLYNQIIGGKNAIVSIRDKYNHYRIRIYDVTNRTEFLLTSRGWHVHKKEVFAYKYSKGFNNQVWFMDIDGNLYVITGPKDLDAADEGMLLTDTFADEDVS